MPTPIYRNTGLSSRLITSAASNPQIVGARWYQCTDQPQTGRLLDGENSGFVGAVRAANQWAEKSSAR